MSTRDDFGWRDRAIALASLGAAALGRLAFTTADITSEKPLQPLEMQVLVALALRESLVADAPDTTGTDWLTRALRVESSVIEEIIDGLERANLVRRSPDAQDVSEVEYDVSDKSDDAVIVNEPPLAITELGLQTVESWLGRTRRHFAGWPPTRPDVDDAVG